MSVTPLRVGTLTAAGQALHSVHLQLEELRGQEHGYAELAARLENITNEPRLPALIPLGPFSSMPGQLVHLNDILVPLGDTKVEMSAKQAREVALKRQKELQEKINVLEQQANQLEKRIGQEAHIDSDLHIDEEGDLINDEGLPIVEINEPESPLGQASVQESKTVAEPHTSPTRARPHLDWRKMADELEQEEEAWLAEQEGRPAPNRQSSTSSVLDSPKLEGDAERPPSAMKQRRSLSSTKRVSFNLNAQDIDEPALTLAQQADTPIVDVFDEPTMPASSDPSTASESVGKPSRPIKDAVEEKPPASAPLSEKAQGKQKAKDTTMDQDTPIMGGVVERAAGDQPVRAPDQALRDWMRLKTEEEMQLDSDDEDWSDSDDSSTYRYEDEDLEGAVEEMDSLMMMREAALAYHRERPNQVRQQAVEQDSDLEADEVRYASCFCQDSFIYSQLVDENGNLRYVNIGNQSRFRGGPLQTASLIIPALSAPRETRAPLTDVDELDFFADAALTPEDRETVRARLAALRDGIDPLAGETRQPDAPISEKSTPVATEPPPTMSLEVKERTVGQTPAAPLAEETGAANNAPKKPSR